MQKSRSNGDMRVTPCYHQIVLKNQNITYFHGLPGSPRELNLFGLKASDRWYSPDRRTLNLKQGLDDHFDRLALDIRARHLNGKGKLIGFSLGAYVALEVASRLPDLSLTIDLVSAAAPLSSHDFLDKMAGKAVFALARDHPALFSALTRAQGFAARITPKLLFDMTFASARGEDRNLRGDPAFRKAMVQIIADCLANDTMNYRREISGYVSDWSQTPSAVPHPVTIWHGQEDNWAPPEMADVLEDSLPNVASVRRLAGQSHYSTLRKYQMDALA